MWGKLLRSVGHNMMLRCMECDGDDTAGGQESLVGNGYWVDSWRLIGRFIHVFAAASVSSSYWADAC
eukprot:scaffold305133_cov68-Attheya_sp.AAC.3